MVGFFFNWVNKNKLVQIGIDKSMFVLMPPTVSETRVQNKKQEEKSPPSLFKEILLRLSNLGTTFDPKYR